MDLMKTKRTLGILTMSDTRFKEGGQDVSGGVIRELTKERYEEVFYRVIPDDFDTIVAALKEAVGLGCTLILTTGGTGLSPRDVTPEATRAVIEKVVPGISEAMRYHSLQITPLAMLSRGVSGICGNSLIVNLPGSPKAVRENLSCVLPALVHGLDVLMGEVRECGRGE